MEVGTYLVGQRRGQHTHEFPLCSQPPHLLPFHLPQLIQKQKDHSWAKGKEKRPQGWKGSPQLTGCSVILILEYGSIPAESKRMTWMKAFKEVKKVEAWFIVLMEVGGLVSFWVISSNVQGLLLATGNHYCTWVLLLVSLGGPLGILRIKVGFVQGR